MKRIYLIILISFPFILSLSSCRFFVSENDLMEIIESGTCKAPCWQGITPGLTTKDEVEIRVLDMLSKENVTSGKSPTYIFRTDDMDGLWLTLKYEKLGLEISVYGKQNIVEEIDFYFWESKPSLKRVLKNVGDPEMIGVCHEFLEIRRELVYFENQKSTLTYIKQFRIDRTSFIVEYLPETKIDRIEYLLNNKYPQYDFVFSWTDFGQSSFNPENDDPDRPCPDYEK
jgi:hypothetical protein